MKEWIKTLVGWLDQALVALVRWVVFGWSAMRLWPHPHVTAGALLDWLSVTYLAIKLIDWIAFLPCQLRRKCECEAHYIPRAPGGHP